METVGLPGVFGYVAIPGFAAVVAVVGLIVLVCGIRGCASIRQA